MYVHNLYKHYTCFIYICGNLNEMANKKNNTVRIKKLLDILPDTVETITESAIEEGVSFKAKAQQLLDKCAGQIKKSK